MKLKIIGMAAALFILVGLDRVAQAQPDVTGPPAQVCDATNNLAGAFTDQYGNVIVLNHSECVVIVSYLESEERDDASINRVAVAECKLEQASGSYPEGSKNFGQCVSYYEDFFNSSDD